MEPKMPFHMNSVSPKKKRKKKKASSYTCCSCWLLTIGRLPILESSDVGTATDVSGGATAIGEKKIKIILYIIYVITGLFYVKLLNKN
ncbi:hypothetical protein AB205_0191980 [Aquarana catesbeiana]|uniref:Uncharacterized protein n=1 Tax=Aquarana catesbeiana TaxID=8400 RepID=A0A2G9SDE0_AQUCT|nr:hypothetical protein AB205_0191980 [Aquarana catesbeiana]